MSASSSPLWDEPSELDLVANDEPVCPHCGYLITDAHFLSELFQGEGTETVTCDRCKQDYDVECEISVFYTTSKPQPKESGSGQEGH